MCSPGPELDRFCSRESVQAHALTVGRQITPLRDLRTLWQMWKVFRRVRPQIVHAHTPKAGLLAMTAAWAAGVPVRIFQIHGLPHMTAEGNRRRLLQWSTRAACALAHRVLCVSFSIRNVAISEGLTPAEKIDVPANGNENGAVVTHYFRLLSQEPARFDLRGMVKRIIDVAVALGGLALLSPLLLVIGLGILLKMGSPVLFRQMRPGLREKPFCLLKFRTMTEEVSQADTPLPDALRRTSLGRLLRETGLDELPQLWNVLKGELSLVGPRPLLRDYLPRCNSFERRRHEVKPGLTGWAQVNGRNELSWQDRFARDVWYIDHWSLGLDLWILLLTVSTLSTRRGISAPGEATMSHFEGSQ